MLWPGPNTVPYITDPAGVVELRKYDQDPTLKLAVDDILGQHYQSIYSKTLAQANRKSIDASVDLGVRY